MSCEAAGVRHQWQLLLRVAVTIATHRCGDAPASTKPTAAFVVTSSLSQILINIFSPLDQHALTMTLNAGRHSGTEQVVVT
jgi:hypothetical protein